MFGGGYSELIVEAEVPDFCHIAPIVDDAVFDGVGQFQDSRLGLGFLSYVHVLVVHAHHNVLILGAAYN